MVEVDAEVSELSNGKGLGGDALPAEVIKAGGPYYSQFLHDVINDSYAMQYAPARWRGGKLKELWKRKGSSQICDQYRGLLLADHASKVFTGTIKTRVQDDIVKSFPKEQYGGTIGGGTLFAAMSTLLFIQYCIALNLSIAILFVDLSKAFDYAIREILLGWMPGFNGSKRELLRSSGVGEECIEELIHYIDTTGGYLRELGASEESVAMLASMHNGSWFKFGNCVRILKTTRGGRQGCRLGALVFNGIYAKALKKLRARLVECGVVLILKSE